MIHTHQTNHEQVKYQTPAKKYTYEIMNIHDRFSDLQVMQHHEYCKDFSMIYIYQ